VCHDEPTASLDPDIADRTLSLIESCAESGSVDRLYSHSRDEVTRICDEVIFLDHGRIVGRYARDSDQTHSRMSGCGDLPRSAAGVIDHSAALWRRFAAGANMVVVTTEQHLVAQAIFEIAQRRRDRRHRDREATLETCSCRLRV